MVRGRSRGKEGEGNLAPTVISKSRRLWDIRTYFNKYNGNTYFISIRQVSLPIDFRYFLLLTN